MEISVTVAMAGLTVALFAYTWLGTALLWSLGTAAVGIPDRVQGRGLMRLVVAAPPGRLRRDVCPRTCRWPGGCS